MAEIKKYSKPVQKIGDKSQLKKPKESEFKETFALDKTNYILMGVGVFFLIFGFVLMGIKGDLYSFRKLHLSVIFVMFGFLFEIYAIMKRPKS
jgi:hypothetical protein